MVKLAFVIVPHLKNDRTQQAAAPTDRTKLLGIIALLVHQIRLIEYFLCLLQADPMLPLDLPALFPIEFEAHACITVIPCWPAY